MSYILLQYIYIVQSAGWDMTLRKSPSWLLITLGSMITFHELFDNLFVRKKSNMEYFIIVIKDLLRFLYLISII